LIGGLVGEAAGINTQKRRMTLAIGRFLFQRMFVRTPAIFTESRNGHCEFQQGWAKTHPFSFVDNRLDRPLIIR
ncbi:MAG: hypothetical protein ABH881_01965, partial [bacterium]